MKPREMLEIRRAHISRFSNISGMDGESSAVDSRANWINRPSGTELKNIITALNRERIHIKKSCFDAIEILNCATINFLDVDDICNNILNMVFIEIKTSNQKRVKPDFSGFFFALTEAEIVAAELLGDRFRVALFNNITKVILLTTVTNIIKRSKSMNWQLSVQL